MKNPLFKNALGNYDNIKITISLWQSIRARINCYLWAKRNKKAFFEWAKALKKNPNIPSILLK